MDRAWLNAINRQTRIDPEKALKKLRALEIEIAGSDLDTKVKTLRTNRLKRGRELREAALFCYGQSCRVQQRVYLIPVEASDYDFVATWGGDDVQHYAPVQLKEVVPEDLNPSASVQSIVDGLAKYPLSPELTVAIHISRQGRFDPNDIRLPPLSIAALWVFGATSEDQSQWVLFGNMLEKPVFTFFEYPT